MGYDLDLLESVQCFSLGLSQEQAHTLSPSAMDMLTLALEVNLKKQIAKTVKIELEYLCKRIAAAYEIDEEDLMKFIQEPSEGIDEIRAKVDKGRNPRPAPRKPSKKKDSDEESASGDDRQKCSATTAKGTACKNNALPGKCYCHAHKKLELPGKVVEEESEDDEPPAIPAKGRKSPEPEAEVVTPPPKAKGKGKGKADEPPPAPKKPAKPAKGKGKAKPQHDHKSDEDEGECSRCAEHGNPKDDGEFTVDQKTKQSLEDILAALEAADMQEEQGDK